MRIFYKKQYTFSKFYFLFVAICFNNFLYTNLDTTNVISEQEEADLDIFVSDDNRASVFSKLDRTETLYGKAALEYVLKNPLSKIEDLNIRQQAIKYLVDESLLFSQIEKELKQFKEGESELISFQETEDSIRKAALEEFFFKFKLLKRYNNSPAMLNIKQMIKVINLSFPLIEHLTLHYFLSEAFKKKFNIGCCGSDHKHEHDDEHDHKHKHASSLTIALYKSYNVVHLLFHCFGVKELIGHIYQKVTLIKELQKKLISISKCIKSLKNIYYLIFLHPEVYQAMSNYPNLDRLFGLGENSLDSQISKKFDQLFSLISQNTFKGNASVFSNYGAILAASNMIKEIQTELILSIKAIGELDAFASIAKLYKETQTTNQKYSFASYINSPTPIVDAKEFWNPMLSISNVNPEQFDLGIENPAHIIITGLNAAGKSTRLRSIALLILLGQTITIVPATFFSFTPFAKISTFIHHSDNLTTGDSLFTNEVNKANKLISDLKHLSKDQFCFIVFDELFKSTSFEQAQESALKLMDFISNFQNIVSITATHFPLLTTLEETKPEDFKNYNAQVFKDEEGNLNFVFKEGISNENDAFKVLNMRNIGFDWNK